MSLSNLMTGRQGEKRFSLLCSEAEVSCTKSDEDDNGWDMLIEFPPEAQPKIAIDLRQTQRIASVQIKTTKGDGRTVSLSLSNALRYARSPLPTFILLVVLRDGDARYFIRHVWLAEIGTWLKAGREADALGVVAVHRKTVRLAFDDTMEVPAAGLLDWIAQTIARIPSYATAKEGIVRTIGFETTTGTGLVTLPAGGRRDILDQMLGLKSGVRAKRFTFTSERFGVRARQPEIDVTDVLFELIAEGEAGTLAAEFPNGTRHVVSAKVFDASFDHLHAIRVVTLCLEVVLGPHDETRAHAHLERDATVSASDIALFAELQATSPGDKVSLVAEFGGRTVDLGAIAMTRAQSAERWKFLVAAMRIVRRVAADAERPVPHLSIAEVHDTWQDIMVTIALAGQGPAMIDFDRASEVPAKVGALLAYCDLPLENARIGIVASRPIMLDRIKRRRRQIHFGPANILYGTLDGGDGERTVEAYRRNLQRLSRSGEVLALGDLGQITTDAFRDLPLQLDRPT